MYGYGYVVVVIFGVQFGVGGVDVLVQLWLQWGIDYLVVDFFVGGGQCVDVFDVQCGQFVEDVFGQVVVCDEVFEGFSGGGIIIWY